MSLVHIIDSKPLDLMVIQEIISKDKKLSLSESSVQRIEKCRAYLDQKIQSSSDPIYGINTGFGSLYDKKISKDDLGNLQNNLVMSHACGLGDEVPCEIVKLILLLKIQSLSFGNSGVDLKTIERLVDMYNNDIFPVIYEQGSLGASGDLAPLAHMSLTLLGLGDVDVLDTSKIDNYKRISSSKILKKMGWSPLKLGPKEGLALLNGTQFMSAFGVWTLVKAKKLSYLADLIAAVSLDAFDCRIDPFDNLIHKLRPHKGQIKTANNVREILKGSNIIKRKNL